MEEKDILNEKRYDRKTRIFQLSHSTVVLLRIFKEKDGNFISHCIEESIIGEYDTLMDTYNIHEQAAKDFIGCLQGTECVAFIEALKNECEIYLEKEGKKQEIIDKKYENYKLKKN